MNTHTIGEITLSLSTLVYFCWFIPQIWLNFRRKNINGLSFWMHSLLLFGYTADLLYGFGRHMQWQYRFVTITGLFFLFIQHSQFARYGLQTRLQKNSFMFVSIAVGIAFIYAVLNFTVLHHGKKYYDIAGFVSDLCWMTYLFPQMIKNYRAKSTIGLSIGFVVLDLTLSALDITSTFTLHWDWPSVLSECVTVLKKSVLLFQIFYYRNNRLSNSVLREKIH